MAKSRKPTTRRRTTRRVTAKARTYRKKPSRSLAASRRKPYTKISRMPVPERYFTRLRYSELMTFTMNAANVLTSYLFQTSIFDPDLTSVGHQPLWRDTMATMFNRYRVFGIKYNIAFKNTNVNQLTWAYIKHSDNSTTETNANTLRERGEGKSIILDSLNGRTNYTRGYLSIPKAYGISKKEFYDDDGFISAIGSSPTKMAYLHLYTLTMHTSAIVHAQVDLEYYVEFMDRVDVISS